MTKETEAEERERERKKGKLVIETSRTNAHCCSSPFLSPFAFGPQMLCKWERKHSTAGICSVEVWSTAPERRKRKETNKKASSAVTLNTHTHTHTLVSRSFTVEPLSLPLCLSLPLLLSYLFFLSVSSFFLYSQRSSLSSLSHQQQQARSSS